MELPVPAGFRGWLMPKAPSSPCSSCLRATGAAAAADPAPSPGKRSRPPRWAHPACLPPAFLPLLPFQPGFLVFFLGKPAQAVLWPSCGLLCPSLSPPWGAGEGWVPTGDKPTGGCISTFKGCSRRVRQCPAPGASPNWHRFFLLPPINSWEHLYWPGPALPASVVLYPERSAKVGKRLGSCEGRAGWTLQPPFLRGTGPSRVPVLSRAGLGIGMSF